MVSAIRTKKGTENWIAYLLGGCTPVMCQRIHSACIIILLYYSVIVKPLYNFFSQKGSQIEMSIFDDGHGIANSLENQTQSITVTFATPTQHKTTDVTITTSFTEIVGISSYETSNYYLTISSFEISGNSLIVSIMNGTMAMGNQTITVDILGY